MTDRADEIAERIEENYSPEPNSGCWLWTGDTQRGYPRICVSLVSFRVHRWVYENTAGRIPRGHVVHHKCGVKCCVNPDHLEAMSPRDHMGMHNTVDGRCKRGHPFTEENTFRRSDGRRTCLTCKRERDLRGFHRRKLRALKEKKP